MKHLLLPLCLLLLALVRDTRPALACGGSYTFYSSVLGVPSLYGDQDYDADGNGVALEQAFLYPYYAAHPSEAELLWKFSYEGLERAPAPDAAPFQRAVASRDDKLARKEARKLIDAWYRLPPVLAAPHRAAMLQAVQYLEQGGGAATPGASPTQKFLELMAEFRRSVPDGWYRGGQGPQGGGVTTLLAKQQSDAEAWRRANPQHPLGDLVQLWQVRTHYFAGKYADAWSSLFKLYERRRVRALAEMRYLVQQGQAPTPQQLDSLTDPLLVSLFVDADTTTPARFERWWRLSKTAKSPTGSLVLQERLLHTLLARPGTPTAPLPAGFPKRAERRSQYWGKLRAVLLLERSRTAEACEQLELLTPERHQAALLAHCRVKLGKPLEAARTPQLDSNEAHYLLQMIAPRAELLKLASDADPMLRAEAAHAIAVERVLARDYAGAAQALKATDLELATDLEQLASIQRRGDKLELGRALRQRKSELLGWMDPGTYRGYSGRVGGGAPAASDEAKNLVRYLEASFGSFQALQPLVEWLEQHPQAANARGVLQEADAAYIELGAYGGWPGLFWEGHLKQHELALRLRRVGKLVRQAKPAP